MPARAHTHTHSIDTSEYYSFKTHLKYINKSNDRTASVNEAYDIFPDAIEFQWFLLSV